MGIFWSILNPLLMLIVYIFVFRVILKASFALEGPNGKSEFAVVLFSGLIIYNFFSECINNAPNLINRNVNYVKKVIFPLEILPIITLSSNLFHLMVNLLVLLVVNLVIGIPINWTIVFIPLLLLPLVLLTSGFLWFFASVGVFLRDAGLGIGIALTILMWASGVFYPVSALPEKYQFVFLLNPLAFIIQQMREIVINGELPNFKGLAFCTVGCFIVAEAGLIWFQKTRRGFANVL